MSAPANELPPLYIPVAERPAPNSNVAQAHDIPPNQVSVAEAAKCLASNEPPALAEGKQSEVA